MIKMMKQRMMSKIKKSLEREENRWQGKDCIQVLIKMTLKISEVGEQEESVTSTKTLINPVPVAMKTPSIATYKIIKQGEKGVYQIVREDGTDIVYINFGAMTKSISRDDLTELYRIVMNKYGMNGPEDELERENEFANDFMDVLNDEESLSKVSLDDMNVDEQEEKLIEPVKAQRRIVDRNQNYVLRSAKERKKRLAMALEFPFGQQPPTTPVPPKRISRSVNYDFILPPDFEEVYFSVNESKRHWVLQSKGIAVERNEITYKFPTVIEDCGIWIMNRLPVKSLLQFCTVSKSWNSYIDSTAFFFNYSVSKSVNDVFYLTYNHGRLGYMIYVDANLIHTPALANLLVSNLKPVGTSNGILSFSYGNNMMGCIANPSIGKKVRVFVPTSEPDGSKILLGFGVRPDNLDPIVLKFSYPSSSEGNWSVHVFTLNTLRWYQLDMNRLPRESIIFKRSTQAVVGEFIYWVGYERVFGDSGDSYKHYLLVSFDMINHRFQEIAIPNLLMRGLDSPLYISINRVEAATTDVMGHRVQVYMENSQSFEYVDIQGNAGSFFVDVWTGGLMCYVDLAKTWFRVSVMNLQLAECNLVFGAMDVTLPVLNLQCVYEELEYRVLLPNDVNYSNLVCYVKKKFKLADGNQICLSYNIGSNHINIIDDDDVCYFVNEVSREEVKKLYIKLGEPTIQVTQSSDTKPIDIDLNVPVFQNPYFIHQWKEKNPLMFVPFPPHAPTLVSESKHKVKFTKHYTFDDKEACIYEIAIKCLREGYQCKVLKSSTERYGVECVQPDCFWYIFSRRINKCTRWRITNINDNHTCSKTQFNPYHRNLSSKLLSKLIVPKVRDVKRVYTPKNIAHDVNMEWNVYISYKKAWTGKQLALASTQGCPIELFAQLPFYCYNLKRGNEGTVTDIDIDDEGRFKMCFIGFGVAIKCFLCYMRPLIIIDAAHLKGTYLGTNLVAVGMDGNNKIIPIVTGVSQDERVHRWQLSGLPCGHVCAVARVEDVSTWEIPNEIQQVFPPDMGKKQSGRPKNKDRIRSQGEGPIINKCGRCGVKGHNRTSCSVPLPKIQNMVTKKQKCTQQADSSQGNNYRSETHQDGNHNVYEQYQMYEPQHVTNSTEYTHQYFMYQHNTESANLHINGLSQWLTPNNFLN
ncbi:transposase, MuDR, MULE transposase domain protein [Tanacetum coccineum]